MHIRYEMLWEIKLGNSNSLGSQKLISKSFSGKTTLKAWRGRDVTSSIDERNSRKVKEISVNYLPPPGKIRGSLKVSSLVTSNSQNESQVMKIGFKLRM